MLQYEGIDPNRIAYDRPSGKLLAFLKKYYLLKDYVPQNNNFVIYKDYFNKNYIIPSEGFVNFEQSIKSNPKIQLSNPFKVNNEQDNRNDDDVAGFDYGNIGKQQKKSNYEQKNTVKYNSTQISYPKDSNKNSNNISNNNQSNLASNYQSHNPRKAQTGYGFRNPVQVVHDYSSNDNKDYNKSMAQTSNQLHKRFTAVGDIDSGQQSSRFQRDIYKFGGHNQKEQSQREVQNFVPNKNFYSETLETKSKLTDYSMPKSNLTRHTELNHIK